MSAVHVVEDAVADLMSAFGEFKTRSDARLAEHQRVIEDIEKRINRPGALAAFGGGAVKGDLAAERKALGAFIKTGSEIEFKALSTDYDPGAGYLTLPAMSSVMTRKLWDGSPIRRLARIQTMTTGTSWQEPLDRDESAAEWVAETAARPALATPTVGLLDIPLNEVFSSQAVTQRLLDLSFTDIGAWIEAKISDKFSRAEGEAFLVGNGVGRPRGILTHDIVAAADTSRAADKLQYIAGGDASAVTADGLRSLYWGLRAGYRSNATWLMSSATAAAVDKLKASTSGEYLWRNALSAGEPPTLLGRPVEIDENMPAVAGNSYPVLFGDFARGYMIVERPGLKMLHDPYTSKPSVVFYAYRRVGGGLADCDAIKVLKVATS